MCIRDRGVGFGPSGEGYILLTAFGKHEDCVEAMKLSLIHIWYSLGALNYYYRTVVQSLASILWEV